MGIQDRDYMRRRPDDAGGRGGGDGSSAESRAEEFFARFLRRHPRFFLYVGLGLGALVILGLILSRFS